MNDFPITYEGWQGSEDIAYMTKQYMQYLLEKGVEIEEVILIIKTGEFFTGFFYMYDPDEKIKSVLVKFKYNGNPLCVSKDGVNVMWNNVLRDTTNECLIRLEAIDNLNKNN